MDPQRDVLHPWGRLLCEEGEFPSLLSCELE